MYYAEQELNEKDSFGNQLPPSNPARSKSSRRGTRGTSVTAHVEIATLLT